MNTIEELIKSLHQQGFETDADLVIHGNNKYGIAYMPIPWPNVTVKENGLSVNLMGKEMNFAVPEDFLEQIKENKNNAPMQSVCTLAKKRGSVLSAGSTFEILMFSSERGSVGDPVFDRAYNDFVLKDLLKSLSITEEKEMKELFKTAYQMYKSSMNITDEFEYIRDAYAQNN